MNVDKEASRLSELTAAALVEAGHGDGDLLESVSYQWQGDFIIIEVEGDVIGTVHKTQLAFERPPELEAN